MKKGFPTPPPRFFASISQNVKSPFEFATHRDYVYIVDEGSL